MSNWSPRTLLDDLLTAKTVRDRAHAQHHPHGGPPLPPVDPHALVQCSCGVLVWPGMLYHVPGLALAVRAQLVHPRLAHEPVTEYICDGCRERVMRDGLADEFQLTAAQGAPPEWVAALRNRRAR